MGAFTNKFTTVFLIINKQVTSKSSNLVVFAMEIFMVALIMVKTMNTFTAVGFYHCLKVSIYTFLFKQKKLINLKL